MLARTSRVGHAAAALLLSAALVACGDGTGATDVTASDGQEPSGSQSEPAPVEVPAADGPVRSRHAVTVLETDAGPVACFGPVLESAPPQCDGEPLAGWRWSDHPEHQRSAGVRWGDFVLIGTWDGVTLDVSEAVPGAQAPAPSDDFPDLTTPCERPERGWVVDSDRTDDLALDAALTAAGSLEGHAETWVDTDGRTRVVNVRVTGDVSAAESEVRRVWGGGLCVEQAIYSEEELVDLAARLQELPGVLTSSAHADVVALEVLHDDGSLQAWVDGTYGAGRVAVRSALIPD